MNHIIWKELLRSKKYMALLFIIFTLLFSIVGTLLINHNREMTELAGPDMEICGEFIRGEETYEYYLKLNVGQWEIPDHEQVDVYYLIRRNLTDWTDEHTQMRVAFSVFGCPMDFIDNRLSEYIVEGRAPELGSHEVLMGENMARLYGLSAGSVFDNSLHSRPIYGDDWMGISTSIEEDIGDDGAQWTVAGIIRSHQKLYDCGLFIPVEEEKIQELCNKVDVYINGRITEKEYLRIKNELVAGMNGEEGYIYQYYNDRVKKQNEIRSIIFPIVISMLVITYVLMIYIFKNDARKIGILNALGLKNRTITKYYLSLFSIICLLGFVTSILLITFYIIIQNGNLAVFMEVSEAAYALELKTCLILISGGIIFLLLLGIIVSVKVYRCKIMNSAAQK